MKHKIVITKRNVTLGLCSAMALNSLPVGVVYAESGSVSQAENGEVTQASAGTNTATYERGGVVYTVQEIEDIGGTDATVGVTGHASGDIKLDDVTIATITSDGDLEDLQTDDVLVITVSSSDVSKLGTDFIITIGSDIISETDDAGSWIYADNSGDATFTYTVPNPAVALEIVVNSPVINVSTALYT